VKPSATVRPQRVSLSRRFGALARQLRPVSVVAEANDVRAFRGGSVLPGHVRSHVAFVAKGGAGVPAPSRPDCIGEVSVGGSHP
jgi:hypothetical protein